MARYDFTYEWKPEGVCVAEFEVAVEFDYSPATPAYFDKSYGNWLPGDDAEIEITEVFLLELANKKPRKVVAPDWLADLVTEYAYTSLSSELADQAAEDAAWRREEYYEFQREKRLDNEITGSI